MSFRFPFTFGLLSSRLSGGPSVSWVFFFFVVSFSGGVLGPMSFVRYLFRPALFVSVYRLLLVRVRSLWCSVVLRVLCHV